MSVATSSSASEPAAESTTAQPARHRRRRWILITVAVIVVVVLGAAAWVAVRGWMAKGELETATGLARQVQEEVMAGDAAGAAKAGAGLARHAQSAADLTSDPIWRLAELTPWIGGNLKVVGSIAASVHAVADDAVKPLAQLAGTFDLAGLAPADGRIDVGMIASAAPAADAATAALTRADDGLADIASIDVIGPIADARAQYAQTVSDALIAVGALDRGAKLLPAMLGADGARDYLFLFLNNAELRAAGGIPGALTILHADDGALTLGQQVGSTEIPPFSPPVAGLPEDTQQVWSANPARYIQDVTFTPQFPVSARLAAEMWRSHFSGTVDGVIATDPVALSYLLKATGPVTLADGEKLTAQNAVQLLLVDSYSRYPDNTVQDAFFAQATNAVFTAVTSGKADPKALIAALARAGDEGRIRLWSADAGEQKLLEQTTLAGLIPTGVNAYGAYLGDSTGGKMDAYLDVKMANGQAACTARPTSQVEVTLTNTAPADAASTLPYRVTAGGVYGTPAGSITTVVAVYGPTDAAVVGVRRDDGDADYLSASEAGHPLGKVTVRLAPGESTTLRFDFLGSAKASHETMTLDSTPMMTPIRVTHLAVRCADRVS